MSLFAAGARGAICGGLCQEKTEQRERERGGTLTRVKRDEGLHRTAVGCCCKREDGYRRVVVGWGWTAMSMGDQGEAPLGCDAYG